MDPRALRTRQALQRALLDLAAERPFEELTVGDIARRAGVNRSTFYQHYADRETLLADALDEVLAATSIDLGSEPIEPGPEAPAALIAYVRHVDERADLYRQALGPRGSGVAAERLRAKIESVVRHHLAQAGGRSPYAGIPPEIVAAGITSSGLGVLRAWLDSTPRAAPDVAALWLWRMLRGSVEAQ